MTGVQTCALPISVQIAEKGTHQELLRLDGIYGRLWQHQSGGFLDDDTTTTTLAEAPRLSA